MTIRAIALGALLTLLIAGGSFYVTEYAGGMSFTSHHFPPIVFAATLVLLLVVNPLLHRVRIRPLGKVELMVFTAIGLAASAWSQGTIGNFASTVAGPAVQHPVKSHWDSVHTFAYIPGGSSELATGYLPRVDELAGRLRETLASGADGDPLRAYAARLGPEATSMLLGKPADRVSLNSGEREQLVRGLNRALAAPSLPDDPALADVRWPEPIAEHLAQRSQAMPAHEVTALNRRLLVALEPELVQPAPAGNGVLLLGGRSDERVIDPLVLGPDADQTVGLGELPWSAWWPVLRLWGGVVLLVGIASLALMVIVHRQWAQHELLPYPIARFIEEATARTDGRLLPDVARSKLFWLALIVFLCWSIIYGLNAWLPHVPALPRKIDFTGLAQMMPDASRIYGFRHFFNPAIFPVIIGFAFFIDEKVSLSMGLSVIIWLILGATLADWGIPMSTNRYDVGNAGPAIRFGACLGMMIMIVYLGRRYYLSLLRRAVGVGGDRTVPVAGIAAVWATLLCSAGATWLLVHYGGMSMWMAMALIGLSLMLVTVMARVNVETGLFMATPEWIPWVMLGGFLGGSGIGTESLVVMAIGGLMLVGSPRDALAPYVINALRITGLRRGQNDADPAEMQGSEQSAVIEERSVGLGRTAVMLGAVVIVVFGVGMTTMLLLAYNLGMPTGSLMSSGAPGVTLGSFSGVLFELNADNSIAQATGVGGWDHLLNARPNATTVTWTAIGLTAVLTCLLARLRLAWWPLHPVMFIVIGTYAANATAFSFLLGFGIRRVIVWLGGKRAFDQAKPFMVGMIAAEVIAVVGWSAAGLVYYMSTGASPTHIQLMP